MTIATSIARSLALPVLFLGGWLAGMGQAQAQDVVYYHTDALGSPVAMTDSSGNVVQRREFEPYGQQLSPLPVADGPGYTGHVSDAATGLSYMQQRYYDPALGLFLSTDPVTANSRGGAFNRYWYANANPYRFKDPDGRKCTTTDGKESCTFDEFKDNKGKVISRDQALSGGNRLTRALGIDRGSRILRAEAVMTAKYSAAKSLAANGGSITIKGNEALGIPDQKVAGATIVNHMEATQTIADAQDGPRGLIAYTPIDPGATSGRGPITFYKDGAKSSNFGQTFGHEIFHTIYSGAGLPNRGWANPDFNYDHQASFNDAADAIH